MTDRVLNRGGAAVGFMSDLNSVEAATVDCLRRWSDGPEAQADLWNDMSSAMGSQNARRAVQSFDQLYGLCARFGRRKLMRHSVACECLGADEACFANFIGAAADGQREDAMMIATLLVRADYAPIVTTLATDFGLALRHLPCPAGRAVLMDTKTTTTLH